MTLRIDRARLDAYDAFALDTALNYSQKRRARNTARGACINENRRNEHGKATDGVRCWRCAIVHRVGVVMARQSPLWDQFKPVPLE